MFIVVLGLLCGSALFWGCKKLPRADRQIIASMPVRERSGGIWTGANFTYYGAILASAQCVSVTLFCILMGSMGCSLLQAGLPAVIMIGICVPASRIVAYFVEKKSNTFTVGGASFVGFIAAPAVIWVANRTGLTSMGVLPFLAALAASYAIGEGIGRLGCISFGCCYGKPLNKCHPAVGMLFRRFHLRFSGKLKKIAYEGGFEGEPVVPVQAVTSALCFIAGLFSIYLFLYGHYRLSFLTAVVITQLWRFASEFLRADYRGKGRVSAYQFMSLAMAVYSFLIVIFLKEGNTAGVTTISEGIKNISTAPYVIFIEALWVIMFIFLGKSTVTGSEIYFFIHRNRI